MKEILEQADEVIRDMEEHIEISEMLKKRQNNNGKTYSLDEVKKIIKESNQNN